MEKMAEKISMELTDEQEQIIKLATSREYDLAIPSQFDAVTNACEILKNVRKELKIEPGEIINVSTPEEKKHNLKQIKKIVEYRKPVKALRAKINKTMESNRKEILSKFDDINKEFGIIEDAMKVGNEIYDEKQKAFKEKEKRLIFNGIQEQFPDFTFTWDDKYINSSREVIESELIDQMKKEKARIELLQMKESFAENKINYHSKEYGIKTEISFEAVSHLFNFEEMTNEEIDEEAEKYIVSIQVIEAEAEEKEAARKEAEKKQKEYEEQQAKKEEAENAKSKTLLVSIECIEKYAGDFKAELEEFLKSKGVIKKYAVKVKGE